MSSGGLLFFTGTAAFLFLFFGAVALSQDNVPPDGSASANRATHGKQLWHLGRILSTFRTRTHIVNISAEQPAAQLQPLVQRPSSSLEEMTQVRQTDFPPAAYRPFTAEDRHEAGLLLNDDPNLDEDKFANVFGVSQFRWARVILFLVIVPLAVAVLLYICLPWKSAA